MNGPNNKIGWCDFTWNPVTGCRFGCRFGETAVPCYAEGIARHFAGGKAWPNGFEPTFHPERLSEPLKVKTPSKIFVSSMGDLFGPWVPDEWIQAVIGAMAAAPQHTFQCLTKAPGMAKKWVMPDNVWLGTTITGGLPKEPERLACVREFQASVRFVSCEPLVGPVDLSVAAPDWVIVGAATGRGGFQPEEAWVTGIEDYAAANGIPIFHKKNLRIRPVARHEWPSSAQITKAA
jgi:protein gp37